MSSNHLTIIVLLFSGLAFIVVAVWKALTVVTNPFTVEVIAPIPTSPNPTIVVSDQGSQGSGVSALVNIAQDSNQPLNSRNEAIKELATQRGTDIASGQAVFKRVCAACHKMHGEGADYAPDLTDVTTRLSREKVVESILNPNAVVEEKYKTTMVLTLDGEVITGLLTAKTEDAVTLFDGKVSREISEDDIEEMQTKDQSSMPERQVDTMTPDEFLNLVQYLCGEG